MHGDGHYCRKCGHCSDDDDKIGFYEYYGRHVDDETRKQWIEKGLLADPSIEATDIKQRYLELAAKMYSPYEKDFKKKENI